MEASNKSKIQYPENEETCVRCERTLNKKRIVYLELDQERVTYHEELPEGRPSQGFFPFGAACAKQQLKETAAKQAKE